MPNLLNRLYASYEQGAMAGLFLLGSALCCVKHALRAQVAPFVPRFGPMTAAAVCAQGNATAEVGAQSPVASFWSAKVGSLPATSTMGV